MPKGKGRQSDLMARIGTTAAIRLRERFCRKESRKRSVCRSDQLGSSCDRSGICGVEGEAPCHASRQLSPPPPHEQNIVEPLGKPCLLGTGGDGLQQDAGGAQRTT